MRRCRPATWPRRSANSKSRWSGGGTTGSGEGGGGGLGQPISRFPQIVCGVGRLGVDLCERLVGRVGTVGIVGWGGDMPGTPRGAVQADLRGWEGAAHKG